MQFLDATQTENALPFHTLIDALHQMFVSGCEVPLRHNHAITAADGATLGNLLLMPAWLPEKWLGVKTVSIFPQNGNVGLPGLHSVYILYSAQTGQPVAILDGDTITSRRTAAASALAARYLSRANSEKLLIVGAGRVASLLADAYCSVRPIKHITIWNPTAAKAEKMVASLREKGLQAAYTDDLATATQQADIITCATLSTEPLIQRQWLKAGTHLDLIGSFTPQMRETDAACFADTSVFTDTEEALMKAGDILAAIEAGTFNKERVLGNLYDLCRGTHTGRRNDAEITVFKSVGTGLEDLAAAALAYESVFGQT